MLGMMAILSDGGITAGVMSEGGKVWQDQRKLGAVMATGIALRRKFAVVSLLITTPILLYLLQHHGASWLTSILILLALIPSFFAALTGKIFEIAPKLHQDLPNLQKIHVKSNFGRLGLIGLTLFVFPWAYVAVLCATFPQIWTNIQLRKRAKIFSRPEGTPDPELEGRIIAVVKRLMPAAIYQAISSQLIIWLISIFGTTETLAQIGGLSRLEIAFSVFLVLFNLVSVPRFARLSAGGSIRTFFVVNQALLAGLLLVVVFVVIGLSDQILWVLGSGYLHLNHELVLIAIAGSFGLANKCTHALLAARSIVLPPHWYILGLTLVQVGLFFVFDISTVAGVILFNLASRVFVYIVHLIYFFVVQPATIPPQS